MNWMFRFLLLVVFLLSAFSGKAQSPYTTEQYSYRTEFDIPYGTSINYAGNPVELYLNLYKPIGDENTHRPLIVLVHGGAWIAGNRNDNDIQLLAPRFVSRGYVVASVSYRFGFHPNPNGGSNTATCTAVTLEGNCVYPADTNEVIRAIYRGMQDVKGAIRFLKGRSSVDSVCTENVYLSGVSAGGFNSLAAAFLDTPNEKPFSTEALSDAPGPSNPLAYCHDYFNSAGSIISRSRPDLGDIEGSIALNGHTSQVKGMANFYGGMMGNLFEQSAGEEPLLYLFHQTTDVIVDCNTAPVMASLSYNCLDPFGFLGCAHVWNMPRASGSCSIAQKAASVSNPLTVFNAVVQNGGPNCLQDPAGHSILGAAARVNEISAFFFDRIVETEQINCDEPLLSKSTYLSELSVFPNPANKFIQISSYKSIQSIQTRDCQGRLMQLDVDCSTQHVKLNTSQLAQGWYFSQIILNDGSSQFIRWMRIISN
jgi:hypothetical protein